MGQLMDEGVEILPSRVVLPVDFATWREALRGDKAGRIFSSLHANERHSVPAKGAAIVDAEHQAASGSVPSHNSETDVLTLDGASIAMMPTVQKVNDYQDKFALGNNIPGKMEIFLARYHNQTFAVFAVGAVLLLWMI